MVAYVHLPDDSKDQLVNILSNWLDNYNDDVCIDIINFLKDDMFIGCKLEKISGSVVNVLAKASNITKFNDYIQNHTPLLKKAIGK